MFIVRKSSKVFWPSELKPIWLVYLDRPRKLVGEIHQVEQLRFKAVNNSKTKFTYHPTFNEALQKLKNNYINT